MLALTVAALAVPEGTSPLLSLLRFSATFAGMSVMFSQGTKKEEQNQPTNTKSCENVTQPSVEIDIDPPQSTCLADT